MSKSARQCIRLFRKHPTLVGFETPERALTQTVKELVDNATDAHRQKIEMEQVQAADAVVFVSFEDHPQAPQFVTLRVCDNGIGCDPRKAVEFLESGSTDELKCRVGAYGAGLSLSLLFCGVYFDCVGYIQSSKKYDLHSIALRIAFDAEDESMKTQERVMVKGSPLETGTYVQLDLSMDRRVLQKSWALLREYVSLLNCSPSIPVPVKLNYGALFADLNTDIPAADVARHPKEIPAFEQRLRSHYQKHVLSSDSAPERAPQLFCRTTIEKVAMEQGGSEDDQETISATVMLIVKDESKRSPEHSEERIPVQVLRYVNGAPLLSSADEARVCQLSSQVKNSKWIAYGCKAKIFAPEDEDLLGYSSADSFALEVEDAFVGKADGGGLECITDMLHGIIVVVNLTTRSSGFNSMRKAALPNTNKRRSKAIRNAVDNCLALLAADPNIGIKLHSYEDLHDYWIDAAVSQLPAVWASIVTESPCVDTARDILQQSRSLTESDDGEDFDTPLAPELLKPRLRAALRRTASTTLAERQSKPTVLTGSERERSAQLAETDQGSTTVISSQEKHGRERERSAQLAERDKNGTTAISSQEEHGREHVSSVQQAETIRKNTTEISSQGEHGIERDSSVQQAETDKKSTTEISSQEERGSGRESSVQQAETDKKSTTEISSQEQRGSGRESSVQQAETDKKSTTEISSQEQRGSGRESNVQQAGTDKKSTTEISSQEERGSGRESSVQQAETDKKSTTEISSQEEGGSGRESSVQQAETDKKSTTGISSQEEHGSERDSNVRQAETDIKSTTEISRQEEHGSGRDSSVQQAETDQESTTEISSHEEYCDIDSDGEIVEI